MAILSAANRLSDYDSVIAMVETTNTAQFPTGSGLTHAITNTVTTEVDLTALITLSGFTNMLSEGDTMWCHFCVYPFDRGSSSAGSGLPFFGIYSVDGNLLAGIKRFTSSSDNCVATVVGGSTVNGVVQYGFNISVIHTIDCSLTFSGGTLTFSWYSNGSLIETVSVAYTHSAGKVPATLKWAPAYIGYYTRNAITLSNVIVATQNTIGMNLAPLVPQAVGVFSDWTGTLASLSDGDDTTVLQADAAGKRYSWTLPALSTSQSIAALVMNMKGFSVQATPASIRPFVRFGGANYDGPTYALPGETVLHRILHVNPSTGVAWVPGNIVNTQLGVLSA
ncbi:glycoside hydrolase [Rhodobacter phage RcDurkin]|nr:glycoside hydrolase [Rhodobacter phage RcDurkin]